MVSAYQNSTAQTEDPDTGIIRFAGRGICAIDSIIQDAYIRDSAIRSLQHYTEFRRLIDRIILDRHRR